MRFMIIVKSCAEFEADVAAHHEKLARATRPWNGSAVSPTPPGVAWRR